MSVTLHYLDQAAWEADARAREDLARIYADAPAERLPAPVDDFIRDHLREGHFYFCARFNGRLLGAVAVQDADAAWWLSHLCVRATTRRRGVGSSMLALVGESARREGRRLRVHGSQLPLADQLLLSRLGYRPTPSGDYFELTLPGQGDAES
jgi:GNAT superfamily N-acetyltransferase